MTLALNHFQPHFNSSKRIFTALRRNLTLRVQSLHKVPTHYFLGGRLLPYHKNESTMRIPSPQYPCGGPAEVPMNQKQSYAA